MADTAVKIPFQEAAAPSTPAATKVVIYAKSDGLMYSKDDAGTETLMSGGGGGAGALILLEQHTASSSASLNFTTAFTSTYDEYQIELLGVVPASNNVALRASLSSDGGSTWNSTSNYYSARTGILNDATEVNVTDGNPTTFWVFGTALSNGASRGVVASMRLFTPLSTTYDKAMLGTVAFTNQANLFGGMLSCLLTVGGTAFNAMQFIMSSGNIASGTIRIYGLAK